LMRPSRSSLREIASALALCPAVPCDVVPHPHARWVGVELQTSIDWIYVNLRVTRAQKVDFRADLLRLVKLV
jgi:hypothetical protein